MKNIRFIALDMDGVIKLGLDPIKGADNTVKELLARGYRIIIITNECRFTSEAVSKQLASIGLEECSKLPVYTAGNSVGDYLLTQSVSSLHIIGESGLAETINSRYYPDPGENGKNIAIIGTINELTDNHITQVETLIASGFEIILTCADLLDPSLYTFKMPLHVLQQCRNASEASVVVVGKPHSIVSDAIVNMFSRVYGRQGCRNDEVLFVGDTMYTDIKMAHSTGFVSALVLSGNTRPNEILKYDYKPDYIIETVNDLLLYLPQL